MARHVVLLRGVNLGPQRRVPMAQLREVLAAAGHGDVRTHLQSGNVLLDADAAPDALAEQVAGELAGAFGFEIDVVVRTAAELDDVVARDPFGAEADDPKRYQVSFLSAELAPDVAAELEGADVAPERVVVSGREIYAWHANGIQRSPLAGRLTARKLGVTPTARNWNTVLKLAELASSAS